MPGALCPMDRTVLICFGARDYVDKILKAPNPAPARRAATKFELVINLKTAKALGLTIPQSCWRTRRGDQ